MPYAEQSGGARIATTGGEGSGQGASRNGSLHCGRPTGWFSRGLRAQTIGRKRRKLLGGHPRHEKSGSASVGQGQRRGSYERAWLANSPGDDGTPPPNSGGQLAALSHRKPGGCNYRKGRAGGPDAQRTVETVTTMGHPQGRDRRTGDDGSTRPAPAEDIEDE